jgi:ketosteroid isomerase-like protein
MTTLERRIQRLEDRVEIEELIAQYGLAMDNRDVAAFPTLFTPDIVMRSGDGVMDTRGLAAVTAMFEGRFRVLGPSNHFTHDKIIRFDEEDPDRATGLLLSHAEMQRKGQPMLAAMRYHDRFRRHEGRWKFEERLLTFFYYVPTHEYLDALGPGLATRNRAYDTATAADWPESLPTWRTYYR